MNWRVFLSTLGLIFIAELGDKTQLTTMLLTTQSKSPLAVFLGAALALALTSLLGVVFGEALLRVVPLPYIRFGAGTLFIILGVLLLLGKG